MRDRTGECCVIILFFRCSWSCARARAAFSGCFVRITPDHARTEERRSSRANLAFRSIFQSESDSPKNLCIVQSTERCDQAPTKRRDPIGFAGLRFPTNFVEAGAADRTSILLKLRRVGSRLTSRDHIKGVLICFALGHSVFPGSCLHEREKKRERRAICLHRAQVSPRRLTRLATLMFGNSAIRAAGNASVLDAVIARALGLN